MLTHSSSTNPLSRWCTVISLGPEGKVWRSASLLELPAASHLWAPNCTCHFDYAGRDKGHSRESYPPFLIYSQGEQYLLHGPHQNVWLTNTRESSCKLKPRLEVPAQDPFPYYDIILNKTWFLRQSSEKQNGCMRKWEQLHRVFSLFHKHKCCN